MRHRWQLRASLLAAVVSLVSTGPASTESTTKKLFDSYDLDSTRFVFNEAGDTGKEDGWIPVGGDTYKVKVTPGKAGGLFIGAPRRGCS